MYSTNTYDASGTGKQMPLFDYVTEPCSKSSENDTARILQAAGIEKCSKHLFWDDLHLSGPAHQLIGKAAASLLRGTHTINAGDSTQGPDSNNNASEKEPASFTLKYPPGY
jgi:phospholipase/lecithinase/hemolysin